MRADRLLTLLLLLQARGPMTAAALAGELEVSVRTIYRDVDALSAAGVPVYTEAGHGGGIRLLEGWRAPLTGLSADEASALLVLGAPQALRDLGMGAPAESARRRVRAAAGLDRGATGDGADGGAGGAGGHVHLDLPRWFRAQEPTPHLPVLAEAISGRQRLRISYQPGRADRRRRSHRVAPLGLVNKAGVWYLVALAAAGRTAVFRAGRIASVAKLDERFERPSAFDLAAFWEAWSAEFQAGLPRMEVVVRASPEAMAVLPEVFGDAVRPALAAAGDADADGWRRVTLTFEHELAAVNRLAGFGGIVEVVSPTSVRERLVANARNTLACHP